MPGRAAVYAGRAKHAGRKSRSRSSLPASTGAERAADPSLFTFEGGPGVWCQSESAAERGAGGAQMDRRRRPSLVDVPRSTGDSDVLCSRKALQGSRACSDSSTASCRSRESAPAARNWMPRADLKLHTTALSVDGVDDVRARASVMTASMSEGGSYGTFAALNGDAPAPRAHRPNRRSSRAPCCPRMRARNQRSRPATPGTAPRPQADRGLRARCRLSRGVSGYRGEIQRLLPARLRGSIPGRGHRLDDPRTGEPSGRWCSAGAPPAQTIRYHCCCLSSDHRGADSAPGHTAAAVAISARLTPKAPISLGNFATSDVGRVLSFRDP